MLRDTPPKVIGARLREKRTALGLSIRDLADKAMVSKTSIVSLEQGKSCRPSTLIRISSALGLHIERFLAPPAEEQPNSARIHRHADDRWFSLLGFASGPVDGLHRPLTDEERAKLRAEGNDPLMLMFRNTPPDAGFIAGMIELSIPSPVRQHPGQEFVFVLKGKASIKVGDTTHDLNEGESIYFSGSDAHNYSPAAGSSLPVSLLSIRID